MLSGLPISLVVCSHIKTVYKRAPEEDILLAQFEAADRNKDNSLSRCERIHVMLCVIYACGSYNAMQWASGFEDACLRVIYVILQCNH